MACLLDTGVLLRFVHKDDPAHAIVEGAVRRLRASGEVLCFASQNIAEFWCVATRPAEARGGLGMTPVQADIETSRIERLFTLLPDDPAIYARWRRLVADLAISGTQVHDARIAAAMYVHGVDRILTLNPTDFDRYSGITAISADDL